jgi:acyl-CoA thioester hydrolase
MHSIPKAKIQVRFADCDVMGHVNNAVYLSYFEMARMHYFHYMVGGQWDWKKNGIILVKNEVTYLKPLLLHDEPEIEVFAGKIGRTSVEMTYELTVNGKLYATGVSKLVCFDFNKQETVPVYAEMLEGFSKLQTK